MGIFNEALSAAYATVTSEVEASRLAIPEELQLVPLVEADQAKFDEETFINKGSGVDRILDLTTSYIKNPNIQQLEKQRESA